MTHYRMRDDAPSAIILAKNPRTSSLDELKSYQGNIIYLNNGDEFKIRLFNPLREKIGVQIGMNGDLSQSLLVLNPGEDVTLDRFLDDKSKMLFETYTYDANNPSASNAVAENGIIDVKFYKEKRTIRPNVKLKSTRGFNTDDTFFNSSGTYATLNNTAGMGNSTLTSSNDVFFSQTLDFASDLDPVDEKETGRVEKGNESTQNFNEVNVEFESFSFYQISYNLKPTSERGTTNVTETKVRDYCVSCGYRIRNTRWNFCPKCGNDV